MPRLADAEEVGLYRVADEIRDRALRRSDSLATPGDAIWTIEHLSALRDRDLSSALERLTVSSPDRPFEDWDRGVAQLAVELLYLHLLATDPEHLSGDRKRQIVLAALAALDRSREWPTRMLEALESGISGVPSPLDDLGSSFLLTWGHALHTLEAQERASIVSDPWRLEEHMRGIDALDPDQPLRHALLHMLEPTIFEPLVTSEAKRAVAEAFRTYVPLEPDEPHVDRQLETIRDWLRESRDIDIESFEDERVRWLWSGESRWAEYLEWIAFFYENWSHFDTEERNYKLELARLGEPLRRAVLSGDEDWLDPLDAYLEADINNLVNWRTRQSFQEWCRETPDRARTALEALWGDASVDARIETFCDYLEHHVGRGPGTRLRLTASLLMIEDPRRYPPYQQRVLRETYTLAEFPPPTSDDEASRYNHALAFFDQIRTDLDVIGVELRDRLDAQGLIWTLVERDLEELDFLYPPERGDFADFRGGQYETPEPEPRDASLESLAERLGFTTAAFRDTADHLQSKGQIILYGPPGTGKTHYAQRFAVWWLAVRNQRLPETARDLSEETGTGRLPQSPEEQSLSVTFHPSYTYEDFVEGFRPVPDGETPETRLQLEDGLFKRLCRRATEAPDETFILMIDEINRANLPKVFGELLTVLEYDKRGTAVQLPQSRESLVVPENLYIIGTMNTVDRGLRHLDAALRRRFRFIEFMPDPDLLAGGTIHGLPLDQFLEALNTRILRQEGRERQIGHAYLLDEAGEPIEDPRTFASIMRYEILPVLQEYCYDDFQRLETYLGPDLIDARRRTIRDEAFESPDQLAEALTRHLLSS